MGEKKSAIVGWYCYLDFIDGVSEDESSLKGKIKAVDDYGVILIRETKNNPDRDEFIPWVQIKKITHRP